ncbi:MAG: hypothetical protein GY801_08610 [bacterium]|nr:hypothetical protein [bacterium]
MHKLIKSHSIYTTEKEQLVEYVQHILQEEMLQEMGVFPGGKAELGAPCLDDRELVLVWEDWKSYPVYVSGAFSGVPAVAAIVTGKLSDMPETLKTANFQLPTFYF